FYLVNKNSGGKGNESFYYSQIVLNKIFRFLKIKIPRKTGHLFSINYSLNYFTTTFVVFTSFPATVLTTYTPAGNEEALTWAVVPFGLSFNTCCPAVLNTAISEILDLADTLKLPFTTVG